MPNEESQEVVTDLDYLKLLTDEYVEGAEKAKLSDLQLEATLSRNNSNVYRAALDVWTIKAGRYAKLLDYERSGDVNRNYSALYLNARRQVMLFQDMIKVAGVQGTEAVMRGVLGSAIQLREPPWDNLESIESREPF